MGEPEARVWLRHYLTRPIHTGHTCHRETDAWFLISSQIMAAVRRVLPSISSSQYLHSPLFRRVEASLCILQPSALTPSPY
ncbi:hypothetical protein PBY51_006058 [Eleginops maclovinus]|nr:hypothetical protein PBY51_006058 [Eleginops maclovinus]